VVRKIKVVTVKDGEGEKEKMTTSNDIHIGGHMIEGCQVSQGPGRKAVVVVRMEGGRDKGV
jgi:hypothetical protein